MTNHHFSSRRRLVFWIDHPTIPDGLESSTACNGDDVDVEDVREAIDGALDEAGAGGGIRCSVTF